MENIIANNPNESNFPIKPEEFWAKFSEALRERWPIEKVDTFWFEDRHKRTDFMVDTLHQLDDKFGCISEPEYWPRVDLSYFNKRGKSWDKWAREAAIEVENEDHWRDEVCKLMEINAGIKVVVAYVDGTGEGGTGALESFWKELPEILRSRKYLTQPCNWLFVFGIFGTKDSDGKDIWDFKAYKFDGEKHTDITGKDRTRPFPQ